MTTEELPRLKWTIDEYHELIRLGILADKKVELIRGDIVEMVPEGEAHSEQSQDADRYLAAILQNRAWVRNAKPITLVNGSEPEPDIAICQPLAESTDSTTLILKIFFG
jgi:Uma2 family endonuclease